MAVHTTGYIANGVKTQTTTERGVSTSFAEGNDPTQQTVVLLQRASAGDDRRYPASLQPPQPPPPVTEIDGTETKVIGQDIQNQFHIVLDNLFKDRGTKDVGIILQDINIEGGVWNATYEQRTITSVSVTAGQGITILSPADGVPIAPQQELDLELSISRDGPAILQATVSFQLGSDVYSFYLSGVRVKTTYFLDMDWSGGTTTIRRFLTSVYKAGTGAETRKAQRHVPIREISTPIVYHSKETAIQARTTADVCTKYDYATPLYMDRSEVTAASTVAKVFCQIDHRRFSVDKLAVVIHKREDTGTREYFDIIRITAVEADGIVAATPLEFSYGIGDIVYPLTVCTPCFDGIEHEVLTDGVGMLEVTSVEKYGIGQALENETYTPNLVRGIPVYPYEINYGDSVGGGYTASGNSADSGRGQAYHAIAAPVVTYSASSVFFNKAEWWDAVGFFNYVKGRYRKFWYTEKLDMYRIKSAASVDFIEIETDVLALDMDYIVYLLLTDAVGNEQIVEVSDRTEITDGVRLDTETRTIGEPVDIRLAKLVRQGTDELEETWITDSVVQMSFDLMELPKAEIV